MMYDLMLCICVYVGYVCYFMLLFMEKFDIMLVQVFVGMINVLLLDVNMVVKLECLNYFDLGVLYQFMLYLMLGLDVYYCDVCYLQDEGQFGNVLLYLVFNYECGWIYGLEGSVNYCNGNFGVYLNLVVLCVQGKGIEIGQFNFGVDELVYINSYWVNFDYDQCLIVLVGVLYWYFGIIYMSDVLFGMGLCNGFVNIEYLLVYWQMNLGVVCDFNLLMLGKFKMCLIVLNIFDCSY